MSVADEFRDLSAPGQVRGQIPPSLTPAGASELAITRELLKSHWKSLLG